MILPDNIGALNVNSVSHGHASDRIPKTSFGGSTDAIPDGARTAFYVPEQFTAGSTMVWLNGLILQKDVAYSEMADCTGYTVHIAPPAGSYLEHDYKTPKI